MAELRQEDILANPQVANLVEVRDLMTMLFNPFRPFNQGGNIGPSTPGPIPGMVGHFPTPEEVQADLDSPTPIMPQGVFGTGGEKQFVPDWLLSGTSGRAVDLGLYGGLGYGGSKIPIRGLGKTFAKNVKGEQGGADFDAIVRALRQRLGDPKESLKSVPVKYIPDPLKKKKKKGKGRKE
jgi:hypothetical protein